MISNRTMSCVFDILSDVGVAQILSLLTQSGIDTFSLDEFFEPTGHFKVVLRQKLLLLDAGSRIELCTAIMELKETIADQVKPNYTFGERWPRFERSLALDGYIIQDGSLVSIDPVVEHLLTAEDPLSKLIAQSSVSEATQIISLIIRSEEDFVKQPPDLNGCLSNLRTALETLTKSLASKIQSGCRDETSISKWGSAVSYLRAKDFITTKEEDILVSTYALLSELHRPVRMEETNMVRFVRSMSLALIWLLCKKATYEGA